jgi:lactate permease
MWSQVYDPLHNIVLSALLAAVPVVVLLGALGVFHVKAHLAALLGLAASLLISIFEFGMPVQKSLTAAIFGAAYGLLPIGWIILNVIFLYQLTLEKGHFKVLQNSIANVTEDRRLQLLLVAFAFGAFFEGAAGFGTPIAVTGAILIGIGFSPLQASGLCLIANTAPVAFGAIGTPVIALAAVTGLDLLQLSKQIGHQLPFFSLIIPFWLIWAFAGFRGMIQIWPAILVTGASFAIPQFLVSTLHGPWLVDIIASLCSMAALTLFLRVWQPETMWLSMSREYPTENADTHATDADPISTIFRYRPEDGTQITRTDTVKAWIPLAILSVFVFLWGIPQFKTFLDGIFNPKLSVPGLDKLVFRVPPLVPEPRPEPAVFALSLLSATGTGILAAAILGGFLMGFSPFGLARVYWQTLKLVRFSLLTIACMLALGFVTRYSGTDATLGLAFAQTGVFYPMFGTLLGWLGVALTGSDTSSNVLFGGLQKITAQQLGLNPVLMAAANSSGGVMGKMIDAQSIVVASTATRWYGHEGEILRFVFFHSIALAILVGVLVTIQAHL